MGGYGSGPSGGSRYSQVGSCERLDLAVLRRRGLLERGTHRELSWQWPGGNSVTLDLDLGESPRYHIAYRLGAGPVRLAGSLLETAPHYGGARWWWSCPSCNARARVLYLPPRARHFACRECHRLRYSVQRLTETSRLIQRSWRLYAQAGSDDGGGSYIYKPKGMHWRTFDRLCDGAEAALHRSIAMSSAGTV